MSDNFTPEFVADELAFLEATKLPPSPAIVYTGLRFVWGSEPVPKPIIPAPTGWWKLKLRRKNLALLYERTPGGLVCHSLFQKDDHWERAFVVDENIRRASAVKPRPQSP